MGAPTVPSVPVGESIPGLCFILCHVFSSSSIEHLSIPLSIQMAMTQTERQDFGWPDHLGRGTNGTGERRKLVRTRVGANLHYAPTEKYFGFNQPRIWA